MGRQTYAEIINSAKLMLAGVKANAEKLAKRGFDAAAVADFEACYQKTQALDAEQETLKARLKTKTVEMDESVAELQSKAGEAKKLVKLDVPKAGWKEFGIADTR